jgi:hypothetical protein
MPRVATMNRNGCMRVIFADADQARPADCVAHDS